MAYSSKFNTIILEIPKCGSRTLYYSLMAHDSNLKYCGHLTFGQVFKEDVKDNPKVIAVVRDPMERLVSAVNYSRQNSNPKDPYSLLDYTLDNKARVHFLPQARFLEYNNKRKYELKLYRFEDIDKAVRELQWDEPAPKHNVSKKSFSMSQLLKYPRLEEFKEYYKRDYGLREKLDE